MQTLHPGAMAGVHDWSRYKEDPLGRLAGTIHWLIAVTFGDMALAEYESSRVSQFHKRVKGRYTDSWGNNRPYSAGHWELLEWAKAAELVGVANPPRLEDAARIRLAHLAMASGS